MKVLHLVKTSTGATWALRQMRELVRLGLEVHVVLPEPGGLTDAYRNAGVTVHHLAIESSPRHPQPTQAAVRNLHGLVKRIRPDVVHSHFVSTTITMRVALRLDHIPMIFQVPGPLHLEHTMFKRAEIAIATAHDYWIASCHRTQDMYLRAGIPRERVFLSYYGIDLPEAPFVRGKLRDELHLPADTPLVGMVAYMYPPKPYLGQRRGLKGHEDLIDALKLVRNDGIPVKGVFIGGAWNSATDYEATVRAYGREQLGDDALFLGTRHDVVDLYPDFDVAVHPSHSENLGGAVESLACRVPTIATNVGGFPDVVIPGRTGWLVSPHDPPGLAKAIETALRYPYNAERMAQHGMELMHQKLSVQRTAAQVRDIYEAVLEKRLARA